MGMSRRWQVKRLWIWVPLLVCIPLLAGGSPTFYVAVNGDNDTGDGSMANPWASIQFALGEVPDGSLILVRPGTYNARTRLDGTFDVGVTVRSEIPYRALLRNDSQAVICYTGQGITLEGFDIAHSGPGSGALVIQIQDLIGDPGGEEATERIVIRNNIIHDSYNNDLLKINFGARDILVEGNLFFNQNGSDEHIDINGVVNVVVQDNIFLNDFAGSGRVNGNDTSSFVVIKNSAGLPLNQGFTVRRNIFLNWEGSSGSNFLLLGEDGQSFYEAEGVLVENNLMLGNAANQIRAAFGVKGCRDVVFRNNTISGDLPANAYATRLNVEGQNPAVDQVAFYNNIWNDPTGTMGAPAGGGSNDFSDTPVGESMNLTLHRNLYWNGGVTLPSNPNDVLNPEDDTSPIEQDPQLLAAQAIQLPGWDSQAGTFATGSNSIREEFERLAELYARPGLGSPVIDQADDTQTPVDDLLGQVRGPSPDIGAYEVAPCFLIADVDDDGDVDGDDVAVLLPGWPDAAVPPLDLDDDGRLTVLDLVLAANQLGMSCLP